MRLLEGKWLWPPPLQPLLASVPSQETSLATTRLGLGREGSAEGRGWWDVSSISHCLPLVRALPPETSQGAEGEGTMKGKGGWLCVGLKSPSLREKR